MRSKKFDIEKVFKNKRLRKELARELEVNENDLLDEPDISDLLRDRISMEGKEVVSMHNDLMCNTVTKWRGKYYLWASELGFSGPHDTLEEALGSDLIDGASYNDLEIESDAVPAKQLKQLGRFSVE